MSGRVAFRSVVAGLAAGAMAIASAGPVWGAEEPAPERSDHAGQISRYYEIESIPTPDGVTAEVGGMTFMPDGRLAVCFHRSGVYMYEPGSGEWTRFSQPLHVPMGIHAVSNDEMIVAQRPELTRLIDTDGDGVAEVYEPVSDEFGQSGNYHEFNFGPAADGAGGYYLGLSNASSGAGIRHEVRGRLNPVANRRRGHYSPVPYRGWVVRVNESGGVEPIASGFRQPNGITVDPEGRLFATDNQGDWVGTSKLYHVRKGHFYGHAPSLHWREGFEGDPLELSVTELDRMRTRAAVQFPHGTMASSPTEPVWDETGGAFGPFSGQAFVGEMNQPRIMRVMLEEVAGQMQGAAVPFYDGAGLRLGNNRMAFGPDGALWVGQTMRSRAWVGATGIQRITWKGEKPPAVRRMSLTDTGFELRFTRPMDEVAVSSPAAYSFERYYYKYQPKYGSDKFDRAEVAVEGVEISEDARRVALDLDDLRPGYVYELRLKGLQSRNGEPIVNTFLAYNVNRLRDGAATARGAQPMRLLGREGVFEAEDAELHGVKTSAKNSGYTGRGWVDYLNPADDAIVWQIHVEKPGAHELAVRYSMDGANRPLRLTVNGEVIEERMAFPDTGGWDVWETVSTATELRAGLNTVRLEATGKSGPDVDHLKLRRR